MEELVLYIVKSLVSKPDDVKLDTKNEDGMVSIQLTVSPDDMGVVIGKNGQTIRSIRKLLVARVMAENNNLRVNLTLQEN
ncbi:MAG: KH domain-containing protein [Candidatus Daviesbacteria bacterium]|nr:KH domain-containing protein [Candidatus Daviesbacteria bacterium]